MATNILRSPHDLLWVPVVLHTDSKMISTEILLSLALGLVILYLFKKWAEYKDTPPGPWGLPIVGYMPFLLIGNQVRMFENFKAKYGKLFSVGIGNYTCVVINDYKLINEAFKEDVFLGRPAFDIQMTRNHGKKRGILFSEGKVWAEQRRFAVRSLKNFGFGKNSMESLLQHEVQELTDFFMENVGKPVNLRSRFNASVLNSLWYICSGSRFEVNDPDFLFLITNIIDNFQKVHATGLAFFFTWPLKKGLLVKGFWKQYIQTRNKVQGLIRTAIQDHEKTYDPSENRDFVDALLEHKKKTTDPESSFYGHEGELNILITLLDLFVAGAETSSSILQWAMLYMIYWPEVQAKVQNEIDTVIGSNRVPTLEDKASLIYTEATLCEIHRFCSLVPLSVYHNAMADTKLAGYKINKNTVVIANIRDAHYDKGYWGDPENFRPERFIDETGTKILKHSEAFMPFSSGKRVCIGENLARDTLFLFFTHLLQKFKIEKAPGTQPLSLEPNGNTFIVAPKPYEIVVNVRGS